MDLIEKLDKKEIKEIFSKNWMTHDGMWYYNVMEELGSEKTNEVNKKAVKAMASFEIKRILEAMGKPKDINVTAFEGLKEIIDTTFNLVLADFMNLHYSFPEKNVFRGVFDECFAREGMKRVGLIETYDCGIYTRVQGWFEELGVEYDMKPEFKGCLIHQNKECEIEFRFHPD